MKEYFITGWLNKKGSSYTISINGRIVKYSVITHNNKKGVTDKFFIHGVSR